MNLDELEARLEALKQKRRTEEEERQRWLSMTAEEKRQIFIDETLAGLTERVGLANDQLMLLHRDLKIMDEQQMVLIQKLQQLVKLTEEIAEYLKPIPETEEEKKLRLLTKIQMLKLLEETKDW